MDKAKHPNYITCPKCGKPGTRQARTINCRKPSCTKCPHGPYWYVAHRIGKGKVTSCYIGKTKPGVKPLEEKKIIGVMKKNG